VRQRAVVAQPGEGPVDHAEEQHRQRLVQGGGAQFRAQRGDGVGIGRDDAALPRLHLFERFGLQELDILGQHAMGMARAGVGVHEAADERAQARLRIQLQRGHGLHLGFQPRHMAARDLHQQPMLVAHVVVQRGLGNAAGGGDLVHGRGRVAAGGKALRRCGQDLLALVLPAGGARAGHAASARRSSAPPARSRGAPGR
jgi:hypothetical protein